MKYNLVDDKGFTLVELLIAIFVLAVGLMGTASLMASGIGGNRLANRLTVESGIAHSVMDEFMARDAGDIVFDSDVIGISYDLDTSGADTTRVVQGVAYSATYSVDMGNPVTGMVKIDIQITGGGRTANITSFKRTI